MKLHKSLDWSNIKEKLEANAEKLWSLSEMEITGGKPDVVGYDKKTDEYIFYDCSAESPKGRRRICYDLEGLESRKEFKPEKNAIDMAADIRKLGGAIFADFRYDTVFVYHNGAQSYYGGRGFRGSLKL